MLSNSVILVISPQEWGKMFVAKHHYALELARRGNKVFFLNPPVQDSLYHIGKGFINIEASGAHEDLFVIRHKLNFPYVLKFKGKALFSFLMKFHISKLLAKIKQLAGAEPAIIWMFDQGNMYPLKFFGDKYKLFHPVDEPLTEQALLSAQGADIIFSVTEEILKKYERYPSPKIFMHHGIADYFFSQQPYQKKPGEPVHVGVSGNLTRPDIDMDIFLQIIKENPEVIFECWGSYNASQSNLGGASGSAMAAFIQQLQGCKNVVLHGPVTSQQLATEFQRMDAFLICYDVNKDQSRGTNYHKIMEYVSTGKVTISNNVTTYSKLPDLVQMVKERDNNGQLPALFKHVISHLSEYNAPELQRKRKEFAKANLYSGNIQQIENKIMEQLKPHAAKQ